MGRAQRLSKSIDELEREIRDSKSMPTNKSKYTGKKMPSLQYKLSQARCAHVSHSDRNEEFLEARKRTTDWSRYSYKRSMRHKWSIYLRSNFVWDWDTASCLERLFELSEELVLPPAPIATVNLSAGEADTWIISTEATLPKKMKVAYKSTTGKTKYKTTMFCPSANDVVSSGRIDAGRRGARGSLGHFANPRYGGGEETERGPGGIARETINGAPEPETDSELGVTDNRYCDDSANEENTEIPKNLKAMFEQQVDQISICSLD